MRGEVHDALARHPALHADLGRLAPDDSEHVLRRHTGVGEGLSDGVDLLPRAGQRQKREAAPLLSFRLASLSRGQLAVVDVAHQQRAHAGAPIGRLQKVLDSEQIGDLEILEEETRAVRGRQRLERQRGEEAIRDDEDAPGAFDRRYDWRPDRVARRDGHRARERVRRRMGRTSWAVMRRWASVAVRAAATGPTAITRGRTPPPVHDREQPLVGSGPSSRI